MFKDETTLYLALCGHGYGTVWIWKGMAGKFVTEQFLYSINVYGNIQHRHGQTYSTA